MAISPDSYSTNQAQRDRRRFLQHRRPKTRFRLPQSLMDSIILVALLCSVSLYLAVQVFAPRQEVCAKEVKLDTSQ